MVKKQAALLYRFASLDYLKQMQVALNDAAGFIEQVLDLAYSQGRDRHLVSQQWGHRETSANRASNARPFLKTFQLTTAKQIAERAIGKYNTTGMTQFQRGIDEYSMNWASPDEQDEYLKKMQACNLLGKTAPGDAYC